MSKFKPFNSLGDLKRKSEHIKKGSILPRRIVKCNSRALQHLIVAGCNQYALQTPKGYLVFCENNDGEFDSVLKINKAKSYMGLEFNGSPYVDGGCTEWRGNNLMSDCESINDLNERLSLMWGI